MNNVLGSNVRDLMTAIEIVEMQDPNYPSDPTKILQVSIQQAWMFQFLIANGVNITKAISKTLDTNHSIVEKQVAGSSRLSYFSEIKPQENEHFVVMGMRFLDGANSTLLSTAWVGGVDDPLAMQGQFDVLSNGLRVAKEKPLLDFTTAEEEADAGWNLLPMPILWEAQTDLELNIVFPAAPTTTDYNLAAELWGWKLIG